MKDDYELKLINKRTGKGRKKIITGESREVVLDLTNYLGNFLRGTIAEIEHDIIDFIKKEANEK